jgi:hypothetical protein
MSNYRETTEDVNITISGQKRTWVRSDTITILNRYGLTPSIRFNKEELTVNPDGTMNHKGLGKLVEVMNDPTVTFPRLNPLDGSVIGQRTYQDLQIDLYSLFIFLAEREESGGNNA